MSRWNGEKVKAVFGGRGFYIALAFCLVAAGVIGYYTLLRPQQPTTPEPSDTQVLQPEWTVPSQPEPDDADEPAAPTMEPAQPEDLLPQVVSPLDGTTVTVFSTTELLYDETMADWRTHSGIDIQAAEGDSVKTAANGKVVKVEDDELMGTTVVIEHAGGYMPAEGSACHGGAGGRRGRRDRAGRLDRERRDGDGRAPALLRQQGRQGHRPFGVRGGLTEKGIALFCQGDFAPNRAFCPLTADKTHSGPTSTVGPAEAGSFGPRPAQGVFCDVHAAAKNGLNFIRGFRAANSVRLLKAAPGT